MAERLITHVTAREVLDCRGVPTVQARVWLDDQFLGAQTFLSVDRLAARGAGPRWWRALPGLWCSASGRKCTAAPTQTHRDSGSAPHLCKLSVP